MDLRPLIKSVIAQKPILLASLATMILIIIAVVGIAGVIRQAEPKVNQPPRPRVSLRLAPTLPPAPPLDQGQAVTTAKPSKAPTATQGAGDQTTSQSVALTQGPEPTPTATPTPTPEPTPQLERRYPTVIKGNWEPAGEYLERILDQHLTEIKALGVNTVSVVPGYEYRDGVPYLRPFRDSRSSSAEAAKQAHIALIKKAKQAGLAVLVSPDFVGGENKDLGVSQTQFEKDLRAISLEWASIAETYQVEYFCPSSEHNWVMKKNFFSADEGNGRAIAATERYYSDILPELRARFKGKLYFKAASQTEPIRMDGYDLIGLDFGHYGNSPADFTKNVRDYFKAFSRNAKTSHIDWVVGEVWLPYRQTGQPEQAPDGRSYDELQDDLFQIVIDEYRNFTGEPKPIGLFFIAYLMPGLDIKDRPAEAVIKDFFAKL